MLGAGWVYNAKDSLPNHDSGERYGLKIHRGAETLAAALQVSPADVPQPWPRGFQTSEKVTNLASRSCPLLGLSSEAA